MTNILLESGTNELEIVEFYINNVRFGVNVTKVEEVRYMPQYRKMPQMPDKIIGFFNLRGKVIPIIDLPQVMDSAPIEPKSGQVIVMHFNQRVVGFLVEKVIKIIRLSWENIIPPPCSFEQHQVIGVIIEPGREKDLIQLIDFEKIMEDISPTFSRLTQEMNVPLDNPSFNRADHNIWVAEDSIMIQQIVKDGLNRGGYTQQKWFPNGAEVWHALQELDEENFHDHIDLLISDIEMPQMDGLHLVKRIKEHAVYQDLPVIMFSSLINENTIHKCQSVGADTQLAKPEVDGLIMTMDELIQQYAERRK